MASRESNPGKRSALVLYGSETGNAQDVAEEIGRLTERLRFDTTVLDLDSIEIVGSPCSLPIPSPPLIRAPSLTC